MTIIEAKQKVLNHLINHDSVSFNDFNKFIETSTDNTEGISACFGALTELANDNIVFLNPLADVAKPATLLYVLKQPLGSRTQTLTIDGELGLRIGEIINSFAEQVGSDGISADPLNINRQDISILCDIIGMLAEANTEEVEVLPEEPKKKNK